MEFYNKHYIRIDNNSYIVKGFSDAFEQPLDTDICIKENGNRHFELRGVINPLIIDINGCHLFKYSNGTITDTTTEERLAEIIQVPKAETLEDKVNNLTIAMANMMGV